MIRPPTSSPSAGAGFLKPPELPRLAQPPQAGFAPALLSPGQFSPGQFGVGQGKPDAADAAPLDPAQSQLPPWANGSDRSLGDAPAGEEPLREAFRDFVGQTLFGQMLSSMRSTVGKPAYFHGGRAEEVFSEQLDQVLVEKITTASASTVADPMYELFNLQRSQ